MQIVRVKAPSEGQTTEDVIESQTETEMDIAWGAVSSLRWVGKHLVSMLYSGTSANLYLEDKEGRHQLCTLDSKETHKYIVSSSDDALCNAARNDELIPYPERKIRLNQDDLHKWGIKDEGTSVSTLLVDGHEISAASILYSSGAGCSREVGWGAELDEYDRIIDSTLTRALLGMTDSDKEADFWRYESVKFFEFEGRAVVVHKMFSDINVAFVEPTGFKRVCSLVERRQFAFSGS
jgi:hypothetical protein